MSNLRDWLEKSGFDWDSGVILYQEAMEGCSPGWAYEVNETIKIDSKHPILDHEFCSGYGGPECPRIFARDDKAIYFPGQYDGSTWLEKIIIDPEHYIGTKELTPYPGG